MLASINAEATSQPGYKHKKLDVSARNLLIQHSWPGNLLQPIAQGLIAADTKQVCSLGLVVVRLTHSPIKVVACDYADDIREKNRLV